MAIYLDAKRVSTYWSVEQQCEACGATWTKVVHTLSRPIHVSTDSSYHRMMTLEKLTDFSRVCLRAKGSDELERRGYDGFGQLDTPLLRACTECPECGWVQSWMQRGWAVKIADRIALALATCTSTVCCAVVMWLLHSNRSPDLPPVSWGATIFVAFIGMVLSALIVGSPTAWLVRKFVAWPRAIRLLKEKEAKAGSPRPIMPQIGIKWGN